MRKVRLVHVYGYMAICLHVLALKLLDDCQWDLMLQVNSVRWILLLFILVSLLYMKLKSDFIIFLKEWFLSKKLSCATQNIELINIYDMYFKIFWYGELTYFRYCSWVWFSYNRSLMMFSLSLFLLL